jgi:hypothetical protein
VIISDTWRSARRYWRNKRHIGKRIKLKLLKGDGGGKSRKFTGRDYERREQDTIAG